MERILRREFDTDSLHVRWDEEMKRYVVSQTSWVGAMRNVQDIYVVAEHNGDFRPLDRRTVQEIRARDKKAFGRWTMGDTLRAARDFEENRSKKFREDIRYRTRHERRQFVKWADQNL